MQAEAIGQLQVRNAAGQMLPLSSFVTVTPSSGPDRVIHYNGYPSADISGGAPPGISSGQVVAVMERLAKEVLPQNKIVQFMATTICANVINCPSGWPTSSTSTRSTAPTG